MTIEALYQIYRQHPSVQTDSRKLQSGDLFFALKGERYNGNQFAQQAIENGAVLVVVDEPVQTSSPDKVVRFDNTLLALQDLARYHRQQFSIPFLAITGSNGKTTSKELIHAVLSSTFRTYTTAGNLNNHIGIPLTLLAIRPDAQMAVIEMGANHLHEIEGYCRYVQPTHGIITNCGKAHLEGFGSLEGVRKGKGELYDYLRAQGGTVFVMWDYDYLRQMSSGIAELVTYGTSHAGLTGVIETNDPYLEVRITGGSSLQQIHSRLVGGYNLANILAAVCVGQYFNVADQKIQAALEGYTPSNSRSQLIRRGSNQIILDAYNANPSSMRAAIENLANTKADNKVLILGAMAELGSDSIAEHRQIINLIAGYPWRQVILVGGDFEKLDPPPPYLVFSDAVQVRDWLIAHPLENSYALVKGSRSMQMEKLLAEG